MNTILTTALVVMTTVALTVAGYTTGKLEGYRMASGMDVAALSAIALPLPSKGGR